MRLIPEPPNADERLKGALLVAATLVGAIRLRGEPITNTPKVIAAIHDSINSGPPHAECGQARPCVWGKLQF